VDGKQSGDHEENGLGRSCVDGKGIEGAAPAADLSSLGGVDCRGIGGHAAVHERAAAGVGWEAEVVSAHRTPEKLVKYSTAARERGLQCIIAGAGGAAHLPGMTAALTDLPVLGVPVQSKALNGVDSLLSIVQMPAGIPAATFAIGKPGAINAALFAVAMLANRSSELAAKLAEFRHNQTDGVLSAVLPPLD
jgi:5-(carboxyamino)imidazole ribonucleotide mutase